MRVENFGIYSSHFFDVVGFKSKSYPKLICLAICLCCGSIIKLELLKMNAVSFSELFLNFTIVGVGLLRLNLMERPIPIGIEHANIPLQPPPPPLLCISAFIGG